jgi:hypothetical protein
MHEVDFTEDEPYSFFHLYRVIHPAPMPTSSIGNGPNTCIPDFEKNDHAGFGRTETRENPDGGG